MAAEEITEDLLDFYRREENEPLYNRIRRGELGPDDWVEPEGSLEGGTRTRGYGHKFAEGERDEPARVRDLDAQLIDDIEKRGEEPAKDFVGERAWEELDTRRRAMLTEAAFNGVLRKSPKYVAAILRNDLEDASWELRDRTYRDAEGQRHVMHRRINAIRRQFDLRDYEPFEL